MEDKQTFKQILESRQYEEQKERLNRSINNFKFEIDYSVFEKTPEEKVKLSVLKAEWKKRQPKAA